MSIDIEILARILEETNNNNEIINNSGDQEKIEFKELKVETETFNNYEQPVNSQAINSPPIDPLLSTAKWTLSSDRILTYSFYEDDVFNGSYYGTQTGVREVSEPVKNNVRSILDGISNVIDVNFVEVQETDTNTFGKLRFMLSNNPSYAFAYYPSTHVLGGDVHLNPSYDNLDGSNGFQNIPGNHGYMTLIHEIGHALGLKHPHEGNSILAVELDNTTNTVMSYKYVGRSAASLMPLDIAALQSIYGATNYRTLNDSYQFSDRIDQFTVNGQSSITTPKLIKRTIWDAGGIDTLDFSDLSTNSSGYHLDLNPGGMLAAKNYYDNGVYKVDGSTYYTTTSGTAIAYDVLLENVVNSSSSDEIFLNSAANIISGYDPTLYTGDDIIWDSDHLDTLDLSLYDAQSVSQSQTGNDLILGLGNNGSITVKDYYLGEALSINYNDSSSSSNNNLDISINDATVVEGNSGTTPMVFTVSLLGNSSVPVSVEYTVTGQTATSGIDYTANNGTLTFNPGETEKTITLEVNGDLSLESDETLTVNLQNPTSNAVIVDGQGIGTITNDDTAPSLPSLSIADFSVNENGTANVTVTLSSAATQTVSVDYSTANDTALAGQDYNATSGTLSFNPGQTQKTFNVGIIDDLVDEPNEETFRINLGNAQNAVIGKGLGMGTIIDNDANSNQSSLLFTLSSNNTLGGISFTPEDIVEYNFSDQSYSQFFDGSDVGLAGLKIDAFEMISDDEILFSFKEATNIAGIGDVDDSDIIKFTATSLGENTNGSFGNELYFDGSDVGLTSNGEDIDGLSIDPLTGELLISTLGNVYVPGVNGRDEDILAFDGTVGNNTSGNWSVYFDGSDVELTESGEDIDAIGMSADQLLLSTVQDFAVTGVSGEDQDVFAFTGSTGSATSGTFEEFFTELSNNDITGVHFN